MARIERFRSFQRNSSTNARCSFPQVTPPKRNGRSANLRGDPVNGASSVYKVSRTVTSFLGSPPSPASTQNRVAGASARHSY